MFCPHCGKEIAEGQVYCRHCGAGPTESGPGSAPAAGGRSKTPWEDRENTGFFGGLFTTLKETLFSPSEFFKRMTVTGGLTDPLLYALIIVMVGLTFFYFWRILLVGAMQDFMPPGMSTAAGQHVFQGISMALMALLTPILIVIGLFVSAGILHMFLMMVKGARAGFEATFRVIAYGYSANIFLVLPICGSFIAVVLAMVLTIIGLKEAHETTGGKAAFAVFFPFIFCCGLVFAAIVLFMGTIAASFGSMIHMYK
jgi:hypothetical protein